MKIICFFPLKIRSIKKKAEFINELGLGGAMVWSIETDDFKGICGRKYPLLKTLNEGLRKEEIESSIEGSEESNETENPDSNDLDFPDDVNENNISTKSSRLKFRYV